MLILVGLQTTGAVADTHTLRVQTTDENINRQEACAPEANTGNLSDMPLDASCHPSVTPFTDNATSNTVGRVDSLWPEEVTTHGMRAGFLDGNTADGQGWILPEDAIHNMRAGFLDGNTADGQGWALPEDALFNMRAGFLHTNTADGRQAWSQTYDWLGASSEKHLMPTHNSSLSDTYDIQPGFLHGTAADGNHASDHFSHGLDAGCNTGAGFLSGSTADDH